LFSSFLGSSVATSLSEAESVKKQVGILYVKGTKFHVRPIPLKTVRPFVFGTVDLATEYKDEPARTMNQGVSWIIFGLK
jgi:double-strand break repair protein MRE11